MSQGVSSSVANIALAVGIAAAVAIAVAFAVPDRNGGKPVHPGARKAVYLRLPPPAPRAAAVPIASNKPVAAAPVDDLRSSGVEEPYEPPAPPTVEAAASPSRPAGEQVAALTPMESAPSAVAPPLRTVELQSHEIHAVPPHDQPMRPVTIVNREDRAPVGHATPKHAELLSPPPRDEGRAPVRSAKETNGVRLAGPAIVTAALELNVAGKPLRLYGVKPPASGDMCAPGTNYAARACPDVSRQALAARIGKDGEVTCRILATGGRQALPAVCADGTGTDLATYLVEHGFALADPNDMVDYSVAETHAKDAHTGLWSYR
jgi:endonuclease YncB( thermonuclease family)